MKKLSFLMAFTMLFGMSYGQLHRCGTHDLIMQKDAEYPGYAASKTKAFEKAQEYGKNNRRTGGDTYKIPVVFHIVHTTEEENLPDSVILSQMDVLNEDYQRLNPDTINTRDIFLPVAANPNIEFYLADIDPDGNPTTGITRTAGEPGLFGYLPIIDNVKYTDQGGIDAWDPDQYVNIWVCNLAFGLGILGYAYPPSDSLDQWPDGSAPEDWNQQGIVLYHKIVGRNNPLAVAPLDVVGEGRTLTHEMGHYLGLRHIWGDGDCTEDDGVEDTPLMNDNSAQTCDSTRNTCVDPIIDKPDMIENYMDYSSETCMNMFTQGQVDIITGVIEEYRSDLTTPIPFVSVSKDLTSQLGFTVFPNPGKDKLNISFGLKNINVSQMNISGISGKTFLTISGNKVSEGIDISGLSNGIYLLNVMTDRGPVNKKFIKE